MRERAHALQAPAMPFAGAAGHARWGDRPSGTVAGRIAAMRFMWSS
jgi:hypothetical protein